MKTTQPTDQPPSDEAVKAAFDWAELMDCADNAPSAIVKKERALNAHRRDTETNAACAARILAAHARARDSEVARLREALERISAMRESRYESTVGIMANVADKALTGEAGA